MGTVPRDPLQEAMRMLGRKPYSCQGMTDALTRKGYSSEEVTRAVQRLQEWEYLSDERFAEERAAHYRGLGKGRLYLEYRLIEQGLTPGKARELMERWYPEHEEVEQARELTTARFANRETTQAEKLRWIRMLKAAGFGEKAIEASGCWDEET